MSEFVPDEKSSENLTESLEIKTNENITVVRQVIHDLAHTDTSPDCKMMNKLDKLVDRTAFSQGLDEDVLKLLIKKAGNESNLVIQKYALECVHKFATASSISEVLSNVVVDFLLSVRESSLQVIASEDLAQLAKLSKVPLSRFQGVYKHLLALVQNETDATAVGLVYRDGPVSIRTKALDGLNALFLRDEDNVSDILSAITDAEEDINSTAVTILPVFTKEHFEASLIVFLDLIRSPESHPLADLSRTLDVLAVMTALAAQQIAHSPTPLSPLSNELLTDIYTVCNARYHAVDATETVQHSSALAMATLGMHTLSVTLADQVMDFFVLLDRIDEVGGREIPSQTPAPLVRTPLERQRSKKRPNMEITKSPSGRDQNTFRGVSDNPSVKTTTSSSGAFSPVKHGDLELVGGLSSFSHDDITTQTEYDHVVSSVAIALKGLSTLLLYKNVHSEERINRVVEMILERTDLFERASLGYDTTMYGYMTSCAFTGVRRLLELGLLSADKVQNDVLPILINGSDYEKNIYGKSRSSARLAMAELIKTGAYPDTAREQLLSILTAKKEKGFSDHNLKTTPKEKLVSVAIDLLSNHNN